MTHSWQHYCRVGVDLSTVLDAMATVPVSVSWRFSHLDQRPLKQDAVSVRMVEPSISLLNPLYQDPFRLSPHYAVGQKVSACMFEALRLKQGFHGPSTGMQQSQLPCLQPMRPVLPKRQPLHCCPKYGQRITVRHQQYGPAFISSFQRAEEALDAL